MKLLSVHDIAQCLNLSEGEAFRLSVSNVVKGPGGSSLTFVVYSKDDGKLVQAIVQYFERDEVTIPYLCRK